MVATIALLFGLALDPAFVASTIASLGTTIHHEYFDPKVIGEGNWEGAGVTPDVTTTAHTSPSTSMSIVPET